MQTTRLWPKTHPWESEEEEDEGKIREGYENFWKDDRNVFYLNCGDGCTIVKYVIKTEQIGFRTYIVYWNSITPQENFEIFFKGNLLLIYHNMDKLWNYNAK